jgi:penicillin G amidase
MRLLFLAFLSLGVMACGDDGDDQPEDPFAGVPLTEELTDESLDDKVSMVRDTYGVAHIYAKTANDAAFAQGFVMAHDRLAQMDMLRRFGSGTLSEQLGGLDPSLIDTDIQMRVHRLRPLAEESLAMMKASGDPTDAAVVSALERFADGVNTYVDQLNTSDRWSLDPQISATFDTKTFTPWSPVDSLVLGRFQAFSLSFTVPTELALAEMYQKLRGAFDNGGGGDLAARRNIAADLMRIAPVGRTSTIDGFPNVTTDSGSRADGGRPRGRAARKAQQEAEKLAAKARAAAAGRPTVPAELFAQARTVFPADYHTGAFGAFGPQAFMAPRSGSNHWTISPQKAGGKTLLATDQHLQLSNPSIFYPIHIVIDGDVKKGGEQVEALGVTFPGIPGIILGTNGSLAWSGTVAYHDVNDVYMEAVAPCGDKNCVSFNGNQVPIETWTETIKVGIKGNILSMRDVTFERVPHHGPILPTIRDGAIVPRTGNTALSIKYTGYQPSFEIRAVWDLTRAKTVDDGFKALRNFAFGGQNWGMIDNAGNIGWTSTVKIPLRAANATSWHPTSNPGGNAPWMILPGDGSAEWEGTMDSRYVPHVINPTKGYIATANNDTTGATFDNNALNQPEVSGRPLYAGMAHSAGLRVERISAELEAAMARGTVTLDDMARLQHDSSSTVGRKLMPVLLAALTQVQTPGGPNVPDDVASYVASLTNEQRARLNDARALLAGWTFATPTGVGQLATPQEGKDSSATVLFNTWMHFFIKSTLDDELGAATFPRQGLDDNLLVRVVYGMLIEPQTMVRSTTTQQPILCDRMGIGGDDSCTRMVIAAALAALDHLATPPGDDNSGGYGSADPATWKWGAKHVLTIRPLVPNPNLLIPAPQEPGSVAGGFPRPGDTFVINRTDTGWQDTSFSQSTDGAAQRFLVEAENGKKMKVKWQLPGGTIYDSRSPHYRDLLDKYYLKQTHFDVPFEVSEIAAAGEERWTFQ